MRSLQGHRQKEYLEQLKAWVDENMEEGLPKLSVNGVSIGHSLLTLYEVYEDERYIETAKEMAEFLTHDARVSATASFSIR